MSATAVVAHGGGPTPVINASLAGLIHEARKHSEIQSLLGARAGLNGLIDNQFFDLLAISPATADEIRLAPGSVLGSSRRALTPEEDVRILDLFRQREVRYFFYTGGNGSMDTALRFDRLAREAGYELNVIGIPKTIDNDLAGTDHTPGHASCARFFAHAARDIGLDNRALPNPVCFVETLGRHTGWVVAGTAHARHRDDDPPHLIYFPECGVSLDKICGDVEDVVRRLGHCVVAVCEGQVDEKGGWFDTDLIAAPGTRSALPANMGHVLAKLVWARTGIRARAEKPGLLGRCSPALASDIDREESWRCGEAALRAALAGRSGEMVSIRRASGTRYESYLETVPLGEVAGIQRRFPLEWINAERNGVRPEYLEWSRPIVGEIAAHPRLTVRE